jgi:site-specific recombinase XerD
VQRIIESKKGSTRRRYEALSNILQGCTRPAMMLADVTPAWFTSFLSYLNKQDYAPNTLAVYVATMRYIVNQAYREGLLPANPIANIKGVGYEETNRTYLTVEEVQRLVAAPCEDEETKRAFLFGCLTGLRHCDIAALTWGDVTKQGDYTRIFFRQAKTKGQEYLDISEQAVKLMGRKGRANELVFPVPHESTMRRHIFNWVRRAGINKHVTFHASRHTFAVMQLEVGTDIYTVSKLLGHREVGTTQVYAKVLDKAKREAIDRIPDILSHRDALSDLWRTVG